MALGEDIVGVLQWGRIHADAEGQPHIELADLMAKASMGPHPCGCGGSTLRAMQPLRIRWLQWGRIHADAEGIRRTCQLLYGSLASMGPHPCGCGGNK